MSGHSHYSTIKRQKESKDAAKGKVFSKMAMAIQIAVKTGGGEDPDGNAKLRVAVEQARAVNMPKSNIERAITAARERSQKLEEITYEGFGPGGVSVVVEVATDNRNRTGQEIKNLFEKVGGSLGGPGSVMFNFQSRGLIVVDLTQKLEDAMLKLIDLGIEDMEDVGNNIEVYTNPEKLFETKTLLDSSGFKISSFELIKKPLNFQVVSDPIIAQKVLNFLDEIENHDGVQRVFANIDIPDQVVKTLASK